MGVSLPPRRQGARIDVSLAIVNIVLLLIFFFLLTGQIAADDRIEGLELAETSDLPLDQLPRPILIIGPQGEWLLDGQEVAPDLLAVALDAMPQPLTLNLLLDRAAPATTLGSLLSHPALRDRDLQLVTLKKRVIR